MRPASIPRGSTCWPGCQNARAGVYRPAFGRVQARLPISLSASHSPSQRQHAVWISSVANTLFVEPDVFTAIAGVDAVDHQSQPFDVRLPAGCAAGIEDDRPRIILGELALDCPRQLLAALAIGFDRYLLDEPVHLRIAIPIPVEARTAAVKDVEERIGIGAAGLQVEPDGEIFAPDLWEIRGCVDRFELAVEINFLQLVDQQHRGIPVKRQVACGYFDLEPLIGSVTVLFHELSGLNAIFLYVGVIARQLPKHLRGHAPQPGGRRLQHAPDIALPSLKISINGMPLKLRPITPRRSRLSKGATSRLMITWRLMTPSGTSSQTACGICCCRSFSNCTVRWYGKVMSSFPDAKVSVAVAGLRMTVYSMPSRYGSPGFQ